jgi:hypothetical protein
MRSKTQKATPFTPTMGKGWMTISGSKSMACSKSEYVNVGDPIRSPREGVWVNKCNSKNTQTVARKSDRA